MAGTALSLALYFQLGTGVWSDVTRDLIASEGVMIDMGVSGNGPTDRVAGTGTMQCTLDNAKRNSGGVAGYYSPLHGSKRSGWGFGQRVVLIGIQTNIDSAKTATLTRTASVATATSTSHGYSSGMYVLVAGAAQDRYNIVAQITVTDGNHFTYPLEDASTPTTPATGTITVRRVYPLHRGQIGDITPDGSLYGQKYVRVTSYDYMRTLAALTVPSLSAKTGKTAAELVQAVLDSLDSSVQPTTTSLESYGSTLPYALYDVRDKAAITVLKQIAVDTNGFLSVNGHGTLTLIGPVTRSMPAHGITVPGVANAVLPSNLDGAYNWVRVAVRPIAQDGSAVAIWTIKDGALEILDTETLTLWVTYQRNNIAGATFLGADTVTWPTKATNTAANGSGTDKTADCVFVITAFATTAKLEITNNSGGTVYLTSAEVWGKGYYTLAPQTYEEIVPKSYGLRLLNLALTYQSDSTTAQALAVALANAYSDLTAIPRSVRLDAHTSDALMTDCLKAALGDSATLSNTLLGLSSQLAIVQSVHWEFRTQLEAICTLGLAPNIGWPT